MKCKYCKYYEFERRIEGCNGEVQIGKCTESGLLYGNLTLAEKEGCPRFNRWEAKYNMGDVFVGDSRQSSYSVSEDWFNGMKKVVDGGDK